MTQHTAPANKILDNIVARRLLGDEEDLSACYQDRVLLIVNTASKCGFTPQYEGLETLYQTYKDKGLVVLGFPSDNFAHQEFSSEQEIQSFCDTQFGVTFPLFARTDVIGHNTHPLFKRLRKSSGTMPKWNFYKYLVSRDGERVKAFSSITKPDAKKLNQSILGFL